MERQDVQGGDGGQPVHKVRLIRAGGVLDAAGCAAAPGVLLLEGRTVRAAGSPQVVGQVADATVEELPGSLVMPGLVNAHCHLDLSGEGIWPAPGDDFRGWVGQVRRLRARQESREVQAAVARGVALSLAGGTTVVGDIVGMPHEPVLEVLRQSPLEGVAYREFFGLGPGQRGTIEAMAALEHHDSGGIRVGLSPHAPYSCGQAVYAAAAASGRPLATHLAETPAEVQFCRHGTGPLREMLEHDIGVWSDDVDVPGCHPVEAVVGHLHGTGALCVHLNWIEPEHAGMLVEAGVTGVYCPRASASFGHAPPTLEQHPWHTLAQSGMPVCLGTDSLLCLDTPDRISVLDEMRLLHRRDGVSADVLLRMATVDGAQALGIDAGRVTFERPAGIIACDAVGASPLGLLDDVLSRGDAPEWVLAPAPS